MENFDLFFEKFNKSDTVENTLGSKIDELEKLYHIHLPIDHKDFIGKYSSMWTPDILDIIVDNDIELNDVQEFWSVEEIIEDRKSGFTSIQKDDLIGFASDCMGNVFAFKKAELNIENPQANVYFFDHDMDTLAIEAPSFTAFVERYLSTLSDFV
jgi:hypothetical protein